MIITGTANVVHDMVWIKDHIEPNEFVTVFDVTGAYAVLSVMGPNSRRLLQQVSPNDFSHDAFLYYAH